MEKKKRGGHEYARSWGCFLSLFSLCPLETVRGSQDHMRSWHGDPGPLEVGGGIGHISANDHHHPKVSLKERRKEIYFPSSCPAGHLTLTPTDDSEEHPAAAVKCLVISFLLFPPAAPAQRHRAILSPCDHYSPVTTRDAELLSEGDRFQARGCGVPSLRHILPQTLPSKQAGGLTLCSPFCRTGTGTSAHGGARTREQPQHRRPRGWGRFITCHFRFSMIFN
nr:uncharacterized protein LOC106036976 [Anser cygnoides]